MIIGGAGSPKTAELFNWRTYEQCQESILSLHILAEKFFGQIFILKFETKFL
jgi:hypothetical protein